jgi:YNFM family putative membrane transporter
MTSTRRLIDGHARDLHIVKIVLATAIFAGAASMRSLDALLPEVAKFYGRSVGTAGAAVTAYAFSYSGGQLLYGPLGDRFGPYRIVTLAAILSGFAALGCALAPNFDSLVALRFFAGGVAAAIGPLTLAWISYATTAQDRPVAVAHMTGASIIGSTAGQVGGGLIGQVFNWQVSFLFVAVLFLLSGFAMAWVGTTHLHLRAIGRGDTRRDGIRKGVSSFSLLRRSAVRLTLTAVGLEGLAMYLSFTYVAAMLQGRLTLGMAAIGLLIACFGVGGIVFVLFARYLVRRVTESRRGVLGGSLLAFGFLLLMLTRSTVVSGFALFILGLGFFMLHNTLQVRATHMAPDTPGAALSLFAGTFFLAQAAGAMIGGWSFDHLGASACLGASAVILAGLGFAVGWLADNQKFDPARR